MPSYEVSVNLSSSLYPFATEMWGRTIMFPQLDENYNRTVFSTVDPGFEKQVPQVFYMHNVMPTTLGYQSIGYEQKAPAATADFETTLIKPFQLQTTDQNDFIYVPCVGSHFVFNGNWVKLASPFPSILPNTQVTTAFIQGQTYIYFANIGCFIYDNIAQQLTEVTLNGLDPTQIISICAANGYMIAASVNAVAWSSIATPTDFTPSLITGAGGGSVNDAKGSIVAALQISGGFIIYCQFNAVGATYTGNSNFPFILLEVSNSGGISTAEQVTYHSNRNAHIMYGSYGLQELNKNSAKGIYTEASDFLASKLFEDFDENSQKLSSLYTAAPVAVKLVVVMGRYVVLSYGITYPNFTHAIVYDMEFKRYGKLKIQHTDCFEWNDPHVTPPAQQIVSRVLPKKSIAFLQAKGEIFLVNFDFSEATASGVFLIGKFQFRRGNWIGHQYGVVDGTPAPGNFSYSIWPTRNGKDFTTPFQGFKNVKLSGLKSSRYDKLVVAQNISLLLSGGFNITSLLLNFTVEGKR